MMFRRRSETGAALIEAAVVIPFLILLVMGIVDIGRLLSASTKVQEAAQEGAIYASYAPDDYLVVRDRVLDSLDDFTIAAGDVSIVCAAGDSIEVSAEVEMDLVTPIISKILGNSVTLTGEAVGSNFTNLSCQPSP